MTIVATFTTASGGTWIETGNPLTPPNGDDLHRETRVFRFTKVGGKTYADWAPLWDVIARGYGCRWYGFGMGPVCDGDFMLC